jgi:biotin carboxyl carrier protein
VIAEYDRQLLIQRIDDYQSSLEQQEANYRTSLANIQVSRDSHEQSVLSARASVERAQLDAKTIPVLSAMQAERTRIALEQAEAQYERLLSEVPYVRIGEEAQLRNAQLDMEQAKLELERAGQNMEKMQVRAPMDGMVVLLTTFRNGEMAIVQEGDQARPGMPFMQVVDMSSMLVKATVNQVDVDKLRIGMKARVQFDAFPGLELPAHLYSIGSVAEASQYRREYVTTVPVILKLDQMDPRVIPDLSVSADVIIEAEPNSLVAPLAGVFRPQGGESPFVYVRAPSGWEKRNVELGSSSNLNAVIRSGVREGEVVSLGEPPSRITGGN